MLKLVVGILKGAVIGGALGYGAYALADATGFGSPWLTYGAIIAKVWTPSAVMVMFGGTEVNLFTWPVTLGGAIGAVYGGFVELDDAIGDDKKPPPAREPGTKQLPAKRPPGKS